MIFIFLRKPWNIFHFLFLKIIQARENFFDFLHVFKKNFPKFLNFIPILDMEIVYSGTSSWWFSFVRSFKSSTEIPSKQDQKNQIATLYLFIWKIISIHQSNLIWLTITIIILTSKIYKIFANFSEAAIFDQTIMHNSSNNTIQRE